MLSSHFDTSLNYIFLQVHFLRLPLSLRDFLVLLADFLSQMNLL